MGKLFEVIKEWSKSVKQAVINFFTQDRGTVVSDPDPVLDLTPIVGGGSDEELNKPTEVLYLDNPVGELLINTKNPNWQAMTPFSKLDNDVSRLSTLSWYRNKIQKVLPEIKEAAEMVGVHWMLIAGIDFRESSFDHSGHFANGDKIIGTDRLTYRVPEGLGPAATWMESVKQAIDYECKVNSTFRGLIAKGYAMTLGDICQAWEIYNGIGYRYHNDLSAYVAAFTNLHDETGRYVSDGNYSNTSKITKPGALALALFLIEKGDIETQILGVEAA